MQVGEDSIIHCQKCNYVANREKAVGKIGPAYVPVFVAARVLYMHVQGFVHKAASGVVMATADLRAFVSSRRPPRAPAHPSAVNVVALLGTDAAGYDPFSFGSSFAGASSKTGFCIRAVGLLSGWANGCLLFGNSFGPLAGWGRMSSRNKAGKSDAG